jgi:hypothetical protein
VEAGGFYGFWVTGVWIVGEGSMVCRCRGMASDGGRLVVVAVCGRRGQTMMVPPAGWWRTSGGQGKRWGGVGVMPV